MNMLNESLVYLYRDKLNLLHATITLILDFRMNKNIQIIPKTYIWPLHNKYWPFCGWWTAYTTYSTYARGLESIPASWVSPSQDTYIHIHTCTLLQLLQFSGFSFLIKYNQFI